MSSQAYAHYADSERLADSRYPDEASKQFMQVQPVSVTGIPGNILRQNEAQNRSQEPLTVSTQRNHERTHNSLVTQQPMHGGAPGSVENIIPNTLVTNTTPLGGVLTTQQDSSEHLNSNEPIRI